MSIAMPLPPALPDTATSRSADRLIVQAAVDGDAEARERLARSCQRTAYLFALHLVRRHDDALDLAQEAMLRFFGSLRRFDPERPVRPWLLRIVRNLVRDRARRLRLRRTESLERDPDTAAIDPPDPALGPEQRAELAQLQRLLWRAVGELEPAFREVIILRDYMDLSYAEIAAALGIPTGTVMSRLHRARGRLQRIVRSTQRGEARHG